MSDPVSVCKVCGTPFNDEESYTAHLESFATPEAYAKHTSEAAEPEE